MVVLNGLVYKCLCNGSLCFVCSQSLRQSLEDCQQELLRSLEASRLLKLQHAQQFEVMAKERSNFENLKHDLIENSKKVVLLLIMYSLMMLIRHVHVYLVYSYAVTSH